MPELYKPMKKFSKKKGLPRGERQRTLRGKNQPKIARQRRGSSKLATRQIPRPWGLATRLEHRRVK